MAIEHVTAVLHGMFDVDPTAKLLMLILAEHARKGSNAVAFPSVDRLAHLACLERRQVQYQLRELEAAGYLHVQQGGGRNRPNAYHINLHKLAAELRKERIGVHGNGGGNGAAERTVSKAVKGAPECTAPYKERVQSKGLKGALHGKKTVHPSAPEPEVEPFNRGPMEISTGTEARTGNPIERSETAEPRSTPIATPATPLIPTRKAWAPKTPEELEAEKRRQLDALQRLQAPGGLQ
jgi:hypothetical protein